MGGKFKEVVIGVLLTIVIIILLIIALYEYTPNKNPISTVETYKRTSQTATTLEEISTSDIATQTNQSIIKSYSITSTDLAIYANNGSYDKKGGDPFAEVEKDETSSSANNSVNNISTNSINNKTNTSTGYFNSTGKNK